MGVNNKQRRAAKNRAAKKRRQRQPRPVPGNPQQPHRGRSGAGSWDPGQPWDRPWGGSPFDHPGLRGEPDWDDHNWEDPRWDEQQDDVGDADWTDPRALVLGLVAGVAAGTVDAGDLAAALPSDTGLAAVVGGHVAAVCAEHLTRAVENGWSPGDLGEVARRRGSARQLPALAALLTEDLAGRPHADVSSRWRQELTALGAPRSADRTTAHGITTLLGLAAALLGLPPVPFVTAPPGSAAVEGEPEDTLEPEHAKALRRVRSLLAKAESTEFDEEAEALSAKAQELISRHALDRLLQRADTDAHSGAAASDVRARRIWLDAPYVAAKAMVVHTVARANRCRSVLLKELGLCALVGSAEDLDSVELLSTSLLVQADRAMLRHGRQVDVRGTSRTRSFRQAFLIAYANRIGERLDEADQAMTDRAVRDEAGGARLLPVLRDQQERVDQALREAFPHLTQHRTQITNRQGWAAGRAAADLARLDAHRRVGQG